MKPLFCNKCRKRINPPSFLLSANIKSEQAIKINCGDPKCKGHASHKIEETK